MEGEAGDTQHASFESSRIIVKNLPRRITQERLKAHFGAKGTITDVRLAKTPDGRSRGFAYVGFGSGKEAKEAVKYFDRTFVDTSRIQVELARPVGDPSLERPWSKYSRGSSAFDTSHGNVQAAKKASQAEDERKKMKEELEKKKKFLMSIYGEGADNGLQKFLSAMKSKSKTKTWENDDDAFGAPQQDKQRKAQTNKKEKKPPKVKIEVAAVPSRKAGANGALVEQVHLKFEESSEEEEEEAAYQKAFGSDESDEELYEDFQLKDEAGEEQEEEDEQINEPKDESKEEPKEELKELSPELIAETGRLFIRNLSYACTEEDLRALFEPLGPLTEVHMPISKETKKPKGFAYVLFMIPEHALKAYLALDGTIFQGRLLHVLPSHEKPVKKEEATGNQSAFKSKKDQELKEQSGKDYNWNSLFMRSDTILDAIAAQLGVEKSQIMDVRSESLATRLAIAETHLIQETKQYLESKGVNLDAFTGKPKERSNTILLVKNLPFDTEVKEIRKMFAKFGNLGRVILPPSTKAIAMVEFLEAAEARTAFKSLAYTKFQNVPLYLEWAPMSSLKAVEHLPEEQVEEPEEVVRVAAVKAEDVLAPQKSDADDMVHSNTLYVTNVNWSTPADTLKQVFSAAGPVKSVSLPTKKKGSEVVPLGFGFVEFESRESLNRALDTLQGTVVDGHELVLKRSNSAPTKPSDATLKNKRKVSELTEEPSAGTKLIIRNIPFEATEKEIKDLFKNFSQVKRVRIPKKFDGQHRGFGFIEFISHQEAKNALQSLAHTHIYGRHLVLEWAKEEDGQDVDAVRQKMASRAIGAPAPSKRTKSDRVSFDPAGDDVIPVEQDDE